LFSLIRVFLMGCHNPLSVSFRMSLCYLPGSHKEQRREEPGNVGQLCSEELPYSWIITSWMKCYTDPYLGHPL